MRLIILFLFTSIACYSQENKIVKYFDSLWLPAKANAAYFKTEFIKQDNYYKCFSYWERTGSLFCKSSYKDTLFQNPLGILVRYYENGAIQDSAYYDNDGSTNELFHFYENGKLWAHCKQQQKKQICEGFNEQGKPINDFVYSKEAEFPGGNTEWSAYLSDALSKFNPGKKGALAGTYKVVVKFIIDENGKVTDTEAETNFGYGMENKAIEIIKKSPKWSHAILLNKTVKAYRRQPLTFVVSNE
jgi:antitoxin component YwqK of YwqJK toxin-antitoxin module